MKRKRTLDDEEIDETLIKKVGQMPDAEMKEAIRKAINDNLKGMTVTELDGSLDADGRTCRQALKYRKQLHFQDADKYPCGKLFYNELRKTFRSHDHPLSLINDQAAKVDTTVNPSLLKAMFEFQKYGRRQSMVGYLSLCINLTLSEAFGVWSFCWQLRPESPAQGNIQQCYTLLELFVRLRMHLDEPWLVHFKPLIGDWCDRVLVQTLKTCKGQGNSRQSSSRRM